MNAVNVINKKFLCAFLNFFLLKTNKTANTLVNTENTTLVKFISLVLFVQNIGHIGLSKLIMYEKVSLVIRKTIYTFLYINLNFIS